MDDTYYKPDYRFRTKDVNGSIVGDIYCSSGDLLQSFTAFSVCFMFLVF